MYGVYMNIAIVVATGTVSITREIIITIATVYAWKIIFLNNDIFEANLSMHIRCLYS